MELTLDQRTIDAIAYKTALILEKRMMKREQPDMVTTSEAAKILGISADRLRHIVSENPSRYPYVKRGEGGKHGRLLFVREELLKR